MAMAVRTVILYFAVVFIFRCMGKRQIGEFQPAELVLAIMVSDLATAPVHNGNISVLSGVIPIFVLMITEIILAFLCQKSIFIRLLVTGKPSIVISKGKIDIKMLKKLRFNIDDLFEALRSAGYMWVEEVEYAILETNGTLSVIPKTKYSPLTLDILYNEESKALLPRNVIKDGKVCYGNLKLLGLDEGWLTKELKKRKISSAKEVFIFTTNGCNSFIQRK